MKDNLRKVISLGAGPPHRGNTPAVLHKTRMGVTVAQWVLDALKVKMPNVTFVAGYQAETVRGAYPDLPVVENKDWQSTGSAASLFEVTFSDNLDLLVCYSDILFRSDVIQKINSSQADITIVFDSDWQRRYIGRNLEDMQSCEKVSVVNGKVLRLGHDIPVDWANGEFIGIVRFNAKAVSELKKLKQKLPDSLQKAYLSELLECLRSRGLIIGAVDVSGDWAEINDPFDIAHFILGTKAETLSRLRGMVSSAVIQDQVSFIVL